MKCNFKVWSSAEICCCFYLKKWGDDQISPRIRQWTITRCTPTIMLIGEKDWTSLFCTTQLIPQSVRVKVLFTVYCNPLPPTYSRNKGKNNEKARAKYFADNLNLPKKKFCCQWKINLSSFVLTLCIYLYFVQKTIKRFMIVWRLLLI